MICWWSLSVKILSFLRLGPFDMAFLGLRDHFITVSRQFQVVCNQKETININKSRKKSWKSIKIVEKNHYKLLPFSIPKAFPGHFFFLRHARCRLQRAVTRSGGPPLQQRPRSDGCVGRGHGVGQRWGSWGGKTWKSLGKMERRKMDTHGKLSWKS